MSDPQVIVDDFRGRAGRIADVLRENPVGLAVGSVSVGFLIDLILPRTALETQHVRDMKHLAIDARKRAFEAGKRSFQEAVRSTLS